MVSFMNKSRTYWPPQVISVAVGLWGYGAGDGAVVGGAKAHPTGLRVGSAAVSGTRPSKKLDDGFCKNATAGRHVWEQRDLRCAIVAGGGLTGEVSAQDADRALPGRWWRGLITRP